MSSTAFQFNERDAEIVHYVYQLHVATLDHLVALTKRSKKALERRIPKLRDRRYLVRLKPRPHKGLYVIGPEGVPLLIQRGYGFAGSGGQEAQRKGVERAYDSARGICTSIHAKHLLLSRHDPLKLIHFQHDEPSLWDSVDTPTHGKLPIRPDAHFVLRGGKGSAANENCHFFLEADVGTMSHTRSR
jgi:hypothetical protein